MRTLFAAVLILGATTSAFAQQKGDRVFVTTAEVDLRTADKVTGRLVRGQSFRVRSTNQEWLWVDQDGSRGWIHRRDVILESQALSYLGQQLQAKPSAADYRIRGELWFRRQKHTLALTDLNESLRMDPTSAGTWCSRGSCWAALGEFQKAIADYDEAIELEPGGECHFNYRGRVFRTLGQLDKALADHDRATELKPNWANPYSDRSAVFVDQRQYEKAVASATRAIALEKYHDSAYYNRGLARYYLGQHEEAIADFDQAIKLAPGHVEYFGQRGLTWAELGRFENAIADYNEALRLDPKNAICIGNRGIARAELGELDAAIADYSNSIQLDPKNPIVYSNRANAWLAKDDLDLALADLNEAIRINPTLPEPYLNRGTLFDERGNLQRAIADYSTAIRLHPSFAIAYKARGDVRLKQQEYRQAVEDYSRSLELDPKNIPATNSLAWLLATCSDPSIRDGEKAVHYATRASELDNWQDWSLHDTLAAAYAESGNLSDAVRWQTKAAEKVAPAQRAEVLSRLAMYRAGKPYHQPGGEEAIAAEIDPTPVADPLGSPAQPKETMASNPGSGGEEVAATISGPAADAFEGLFDQEEPEALDGIDIVAREEPESRHGERVARAEEEAHALDGLFDDGLFDDDLTEGPRGFDVSTDHVQAEVAPSQDDVELPARPRYGALLAPGRALVRAFGAFMPHVPLADLGGGGPAPDARNAFDGLPEAELGAEDGANRMQPEQFPLPPDASDVERDADIQWIVFRSKQPAAKIAQFYQDDLAKKGFVLDKEATFVADDANIGSMGFSRRGRELTIVIQDGKPESTSRVLIEGDVLRWPQDEIGAGVIEEVEPLKLIQADMKLGDQLAANQQIRTKASVTLGDESFELTFCVGYQVKEYDGPHTMLWFANREIPIKQFRREVLEKGGSMFDVFEQPFGLNYVELDIAESSVSITSQINNAFSSFSTKEGKLSGQVQSGRARGQLRFSKKVFDEPWKLDAIFDVPLLDEE